jgi:hypothetical protein
VGSLALWQTELTRDIGDPPAERHAVAPRIETEDLDPASRRTQQVQDAADRRRLTGSIRTEEPEHLPPSDLEIDAPDSVDAAVIFDESADPQHGFVRVPWGPH